MNDDDDFGCLVTRSCADVAAYLRAHSHECGDVMRCDASKSQPNGHIQKHAIPGKVVCVNVYVFVFIILIESMYV